MNFIRLIAELKMIGGWMKMKTIEIVGENYFGYWDKTRTACRGIVIDGERIFFHMKQKQISG